MQGSIVVFGSADLVDNLVAHGGDDLLRVRLWSTCGTLWFAFYDQALAWCNYGWRRHLYRAAYHRWLERVEAEELGKTDRFRTDASNLITLQTHRCERCSCQEGAGGG